MTPSPDCLPVPFEVWLCHFRFIDMPHVKKVRPAVILEVDEGELMVVAIKVTSHEPRNEPGEIVVKNLDSAGLLKQSTIRCSQAIEIPLADLIRPIGKLAPIDVAALVETIWQIGLAKK